MPYALFSHGEKVSKSYATKQELIDQAIKSGLVTEPVAPRKITIEDLKEQGFVIGKAPNDPAEPQISTGMSEADIEDVIDEARQSAEGSRRIVNSIRPSGS